MVLSTKELYKNFCIVSLYLKTKSFVMQYFNKLHTTIKCCKLCHIKTDELQYHILLFVHGEKVSWLQVFSFIPLKIFAVAKYSTNNGQV